MEVGKLAFGNKKNNGSKNDNSKKGSMFGKAKKIRTRTKRNMCLKMARKILL